METVTNQNSFLPREETTLFAQIGQPRTTHISLLSSTFSFLLCVSHFFSMGFNNPLLQILIKSGFVNTGLGVTYNMLLRTYTADRLRERSYKLAKS